MKPGRFLFAENEAYVGGPDIGSNTRTTPPSVNQTDGRYRGYRPAPDVTNYIYHRAAKVQEFLARMQVANIDTFDIYIPGGGLNNSLRCGTHGIGDTLANDPENYTFFLGRSAGTTHEYRADHRGFIGRTLALAHVGTATVDIDHENNKVNHHRIAVFDDGTTGDLVYYTTALVPAYGVVTFTAGAPTYDWRVVGCDRNSSGSPVWCIGTAAKAGQTYIWRSTNGTSFATVGAGYPSATVTTDLQFLKHTRHEVDALGPDDTGNASWLALSDTYAVRSTDGSTWTAAAHGLALGGGNLHSRCAAYSRINTRWIVPAPLNAAGDVYYTEDNGASWSTFAAAIPEVGSVAEFFITSDYHGTFIATWTGSADEYIISTDNGETWSKPIAFRSYQVTTTPLYATPEFVIDEVTQAYESSRSPDYAVIAALDTVPGNDEFELYKTLMY